MCVMFYRRDTHVAELQMGTPAARLEDACAPKNFDVHRTPFVTLLGNCSAHQQVAIKLALTNPISFSPCHRS